MTEFISTENGLDLLTQMNAATGPRRENTDRVLLKYLMQNIREAVLLIGPDQRIVAWNRATENLLGFQLPADANLDWFFDHVQLTPRQHSQFTPNDSSVRDALCNHQEMVLCATMSIGGSAVAPVELQVIPLPAEAGGHMGSMLILHDATFKVDLQRQVQDLMAKSSSDPLTGVHNRAEFERVLVANCRELSATSAGFSLIICDIDHFKRINDEFGHDVGDQALVAFAQVVRGGLRTDDLLARFGGEEFVMICHNCDANAAMEIAEKIRLRLEQTSQPMLADKCLTASFGVAHSHPSDTPKSIFVRADKALLRAKESGRNRVVYSKYLESGATSFVGAVDEYSDPNYFPGDFVLTREVNSTSPIEVLAAKLEGFVHEQQAKLLVVEPRRLVLQSADHASLLRRSSDRKIAFQIEILFEDLSRHQRDSRGYTLNTGLKIRISLVRQRDRRLTDVRQQAEQLARSLFSFLMIATPALDERKTKNDAE